MPKIACCSLKDFLRESSRNRAKIYYSSTQVEMEGGAVVWNFCLTFVDKRDLLNEFSIQMPLGEPKSKDPAVAKQFQLSQVNAETLSKVIMDHLKKCIRELAPGRICPDAVMGTLLGCVDEDEIIKPYKVALGEALKRFGPLEKPEAPSMREVKKGKAPKRLLEESKVRKGGVGVEPIEPKPPGDPIGQGTP